MSLCVWIWLTLRERIVIQITSKGLINYTDRLYYICNSADLFLARWTLSPQQSVAQNGAIWLAGSIPDHLDGGRRQSISSQRLHSAGNLDCRDINKTKHCSHTLTNTDTSYNTCTLTKMVFIYQLNINVGKSREVVGSWLRELFKKVTLCHQITYNKNQKVWHLTVYLRKRQLIST